MLQEKSGQEMLLIDFLPSPGVAKCPTCQETVPHGPDGLRSRLKQSLPSISEEELEAVVTGKMKKEGALSEGEELKLRYNAPFISVRFQHEFRGLPDSNERIQAAMKAVGDGCMDQPEVLRAHKVISLQNLIALIRFLY